MYRKVSLILFFFMLINFHTSITSEALEVSSKSVILLEANSGRVLYKKNCNEVIPMASTTKIMTAIVALEYGNLDDMVVIDNIAPTIEGSSIYLKENDIITLEDLIYGLMLRSGNDAAYMIAKHIAGNEDNYINLMNEKAKIIGANNTNFTNPHGLHDENHYTTAADMALITRYAFKNNMFKNIVSTKKTDIKINDEIRIIYNKNKLLSEYSGGNGVKTGYTIDAGKCLVFSCARDGMQLIGVILDSADIWVDSKFILDYAFDNYEMKKVLEKDEYINTICIKNGINDQLKIISNEDIYIPVKEGESAIRQLIIFDYYEAPIFLKQKVGILDFYIDDELVYTKNFYSPQKIYEKNYLKFLYENIFNYLRFDI